MDKRVSFLFFFLVGLNSYAQLETSNWYFGGNAGLRFTPDGPTPIYDGALETIEGCATISDQEGNLLFYTDGITVYNREHVVMQNGTSLQGNPSSTQSAIIVPFPGNSNRYYIFTVDANDFNPAAIRGLSYSVVDMTMDDGRGEVINEEKNINLLLRSSEKITSVKHRNGQGFWLITHFEGTFFSFLIDSNGVNATPVESTVGPFISTNGYPAQARGYMKLSPNGERIAIAHLTLDSSGFSSSPGYLGVYDFDDENGVVSNESVLNLDANGNLLGSPYGIEFSPNNRFLYAQLDIHNPINNAWIDAFVAQYDLDQLPNVQRTIISNPGQFEEMGIVGVLRSRGALQLGLDGKIYMATVRNNSNANYAGFNGFGGEALSVIENPNELGLLSNYRHEAIQINNPMNPTTWVAYGLPPFITSFFQANLIFEGGVLRTGDGCLGTEITVRIETEATISEINWDFGDGTTLTTTNLDPVMHTYNQAGAYTVSVIVTTIDGTQLENTQDIEIFDNPVVSDATLIACDNNTDGLSVFDLTRAQGMIVPNPDDFTFSYHNSAEDANLNEEHIQNFTLYANTIVGERIFVRTTGSSGCHTVAEITLQTTNELIEISPLPLCDIENDGFEEFNLPIKESEILTNEFFDLPDDEYQFFYYESVEDAINRVEEITQTELTNYTNESLPQTIYVRVDSEFNCEAIVTFDLELIPEPVIVLEPQIICPDGASDPEFQTTILDAGEGFLSYQWDGLTGDDLNQALDQSTITVSNPGTYTVTIVGNNICGPRSFSVNVTESSLPQITGFEFVGIDNVSIIASGDFMPFDYSLDQQMWQPGNNSFFGLNSGDYTAYVRNTNGCISSETFGIIFIPNTITPNNDGFNDDWKIPGLRGFQNVHIQIFDRYGKTIKDFIFNPGSTGGINPANSFTETPTGTIDENLWDGKYLGRPVPTSSYWYKIQMPDGRLFTGWLAVKNH